MILFKSHCLIQLQNQIVTITKYIAIYYRILLCLACNLKPQREKCQTKGLKLEGADNWTPTMYIRLVQDFGLEFEVAQHLANSFGDRAFAVAKMASITGIISSV